MLANAMPADEVRKLTAWIREAIAADPQELTYAATTGRRMLMDGQDLILCIFPLREGPDDACRVAQAISLNPGLVHDLMDAALSDIDAKAHEPLKRTLDGDLLDYHFPTDLTHPFKAVVDGKNISFLLTVEPFTGISVSQPTPLLTLYTRDAR